MSRELRFERAGRLAWHERPEPVLVDPGDAIVRPFIAGRCDGDTLPLHRPVSRALQAGMALGLVDPVVGAICGKVPFRGPFAIGHECVAESFGARTGSVRGEYDVVVEATSRPTDSAAPCAHSHRAGCARRSATTWPPARACR